MTIYLIAGLLEPGEVVYKVRGRPGGVWWSIHRRWLVGVPSHREWRLLEGSE